MSEYDPTNTGVFFNPMDNQRLVGSGKLNINGRDDRIVIVREPVKRDGEPQLVVYKKVGVLFSNDKKGNDKAPDYTGPIDNIGPEMRIAGWRGEKDGRPYMTLKASLKQSAEGQGAAAYDQSPAKPKRFVSTIEDDDIPF